MNNEKAIETFNKLKEQKEELLAELAPHVSERDELLASIQNTLEKEKEIIKKIRDVHERMAIVDYQISGLAKYLGAHRIMAQLK